MTADITKSSGIRNKILVIAQCLIAFAFVIRCNSMWITLQDTEDITKKLAYAMIFLGILLSIFASRAIYNRRRLVLSIAAVGVFAVYLIIFLFITDFAHKIFLRDAIIFLALVLYYFLVEDVDQIPGVLVRYEYIVTVVAVLSVVCWLVFSVLRLIPSSGESFTWWNGTDHYTGVDCYYGIYFEPQNVVMFGRTIVRNCGFFTEAPMASMHFAIAFLVNIFLEKKTSVLRAILLAVAVVTTFSATGLAVVAAAAILKGLMILFRSEKYRRLPGSRKLLIRLLIVAAVILVLVLGFVFLKDKAGSVSWRIRVQDMKATLAAWLDRPVFGNGVYNFDAVKAHFPGERATYAGFSCTTALGTILADGGLMFAFLYLGAFVSAVIKAVRNREYQLMFFAILILLIFIMTIVAYDYITLFLFLFMGVYKSRLYHFFADKL